MEKPATIEDSAAGKSTHSFFTRTFFSLRHPNFRYLFVGTVFMSAGQWIQNVTLGWLVYDLTGSSVLLGMLNGLRALPFLITSPIAGVVADRTDRRTILIVRESLLMLTALIMGVVVGAGYADVWQVFVFTSITAVAWSFVDPVRQSMLPTLVPKEDLMNAVALNSAAFNMTKIIGPSLGGLLIALFGASGNFYVQGLAYAGVLFSLYCMTARPSSTEARRSSALANLKEGMNYVWRQPAVFALMTSALIPRIIAMPYQTLMPVFQKDVLHVGPEGLGLLLAAPGLGASLAGFTLATVSSRIKRQGWVLIFSLIGLGASMNIFAWTISFPLALVVLVANGAFQVIYMATTNTMLQVIVPDHLRGRVMSIYMLDRGLMPLGSLAAGVGAHWVGAPATVGFMGLAVVILAVLLAWRAPVVRELGVSASH